jgi:hypothetical protein
MKLDVPTLPTGQRSWFVRRDASGALEWILLRPFDDGSALLRTIARAETCSPPNGPREAVDRLIEQGFHSLESDEGAAIAAGAKPPNW